MAAFSSINYKRSGVAGRYKEHELGTRRGQILQEVQFADIESSLIFPKLIVLIPHNIDFCNADIALDIMRSSSKRYLRRFELIMLNPLILMCVFSCV